VGLSGFDEGVRVPGVEAVEAHTGLAGAVNGGDAVFGAAAEALDVSHGARVGGGVLGDLGVERAAELAIVGGVVARAGAADQQGHRRLRAVREADTRNGGVSASARC